MDVAAVRTALATALTGQGFRVYDAAPESAQLPCAVVMWPDEIRFHRTGADGVELDLVVTVAVSLTDFAKAQRDIDAVMSTPGLSTVLEAHQTPAWFQALVQSSSNVRQLDVGAQALAVDLNITLIA